MGLKDIGNKFRRRGSATPEPLMPGEAVNGEFVFEKGNVGKRYDLVAAFDRTREIADAREKLGLTEDDLQVEGVLDEFETLEEAAE